jgi:hypothetical protein
MIVMLRNLLNLTRNAKVKNLEKANDAFVKDYDEEVTVAME